MLKIFICSNTHRILHFPNKLVHFEEKMTTPHYAVPTGGPKPEEFVKFHQMLTIIPTCQGFVKEPTTSGQIPPDWKKCVIDDLEAHLPAIVKGPVAPQDNFFNCRKSVYQQCLSIVEFSRNVAEVLEMLDGVNSSLYLLVIQHPRNGGINLMASFFLLALKLIEFVAWEAFDKQTGEKVKRNLVEILKDLKGFRRESEGLQKKAESVGTAAGKVFKTGPYTNVLVLESQGRRMSRSEDVSPANRASTEAGGVKLGLTHSNEVIMDNGMVKLVKLPPSLQLGLLIMICQHIKHLLTTTTHQLKRVKSLLSNVKTPKKLTRIMSVQLSIFELALLRKSNGLLTQSSHDLTQLVLSMNHRSKFLYELRRPFKILKKDLLATGYDPLIDNNHFVMFQVSLDKESRLKKYIQDDCLNEDAAQFIIRNFGNRN